MVKVAYTVRNLHGKLLHRIRIIPDQDDRVLLFFYSTFQIVGPCHCTLHTSSVTCTILLYLHHLRQDCSGNVGRSFTHIPTWSCHVTNWPYTSWMIWHGNDDHHVTQSRALNLYLFDQGISFSPSDTIKGWHEPTMDRYPFKKKQWIGKQVKKRKSSELEEYVGDDWDKSNKNPAMQLS